MNLMLDFMPSNPIWLLDEHRRSRFRHSGLFYSTSLGMLGFVAMAVTTGWIAGDWKGGVGFASGLQGIVLLLLLVCLPITQGFEVVARQCRTRILDTLVCTPQSSTQMVLGLYLTALRASVEILLGFAAPLLAVAMACAVADGLWHVGALLALITLAGIFTGLLVAFGLVLGLRSRGQERLIAGPVFVGLVGYMAALLGWHWLVRDMAWQWAALDPTVMTYGLLLPGAGAGGWIPFWPHLVYLAMTGLLLTWCSRSGLACLTTPLEEKSGVSRRSRPHRYRKVSWLRGAYAADAVNRLSRHWRARPWVLLGSFFWLYGLGFGTMTPELGAGAVQAFVFFIWASSGPTGWSSGIISLTNWRFLFRQGFPPGTSSRASGCPRSCRCDTHWHSIAF